MNNIKKYIYIFLGLLCVTLGSIGVALPGLPTTPFLLLASWFFYRSSKRMQTWLLASWMGKYIRSYQEKGGMETKTKLWVLFFMTTMVIISTIWLIPDDSIAKIIVPIAGGIGCFVVWFIVPTAQTVKKKKEL